MTQERSLLAVYLDFENLALGFRGQNDRFDIGRVIDRLVEKGMLVVKRAYADWKRFSTYAGPLQEHAFELMQIPARRLTGKNSADMRLCVDVMDLCYSKSHIDTFVIVSGDSDFSPLVSKLRENGRTVIGLGMRQSTSNLLRDNCDEFIYYEDLEAELDDVAAEVPDGDEKQQKLYTLLLESLQALRRENRDVLWASMVKETMKRKRPSFSEGYFGFRSFTELLEDAEKKGLVKLERDSSRRTCFVTAFGDEVTGAKRPSRRSRRGGGSSSSSSSSSSGSSSSSSSSSSTSSSSSKAPTSSSSSSSSSGGRTSRSRSSKATSRSGNGDSGSSRAGTASGPPEADEPDTATGRRRRRPTSGS